MKRILLVLGLLLLEPAAARADDPAHPAAMPGPTPDALGQHEVPERFPPTQSASSMQERPHLPVPQAVRRAPPKPGIFEVLFGGYTEDKATFFKIAFAVILIALLSWGVVLEERKQGKRWLKQRRLAIAVLGILGVAGWFNYGKFHAGTFVHHWEHYHYYVGAKYFPELRYARLYECSAIAETEMGRRELVEKRMVRDIASTNLIGPTTDILAHPERCKQHFTPERWEQFKEDVRFFIARLGSRWPESQKDHGFNGTPWWAVAGTFLANHVGPAGEATMTKLALFDPAMLVLMFAAIWWAFGVEIFAVAATFFAVNFPSRYWWNGGAFLRYDYLAASVIGICLLRKLKPVAGGGLLAFGAALRIFPVFFAVGPAVQGLWRLFKERSFPSEHRRILLGALVAAAILVPLSFVVGKGGPEIYQEFTHNTLKHADTPLTNHMGLRTILSWRVRFHLGEGDSIGDKLRGAGISFDNARYLRDGRLDDPFQIWKERRLGNFRQLFPLFVLINLVLLWGIWRVTRDEPAWMAAALSGVVLVATATELTCYYYAFMIPAAFLMEKKKDYGMWLVLLGIGTHAITKIQIWDDDKYVLMSLASVAYGAGVVWDMYKDKRALPAAASQPATVAAVAEIPRARAGQGAGKKKRAR